MLVTASARLRYVSIPPRKMRLVANMVKGMPVEKALGILNFTPKIAAHHIAKTLKSAAANALSIEGTDTLQPEDLVIKDIRVDAAPTAKRIQFQSMGRVFRIRKRYCHLTIKVEAEVETSEKARPGSKKVKKADTADTASKEAKKTKKSTAKKTASKKVSGAKKTAPKAKVKTKVDTKQTGSSKGRSGEK